MALREVGGDGCRQQDGYADREIVSFDLHAEGFCDGQDCPLGCGVDRSRGVGGDRRHRRRDHHVPSSCGQHGRQEGPQAVHGSHQVDPEGALPLRGRQLPQAPAGRSGDAGVGAQQARRTERFQAAAGGRLYLIRLADIDGEGQQARNFRGQFIEAVLTLVQGRHWHALGRTAAHQSPTDPAGPAGDDRGLTLPADDHAIGANRGRARVSLSLSNTIRTRSPIETVSGSKSMTLAIRREPAPCVPSSSITADT